MQYSKNPFAKKIKQAIVVLLIFCIIFVAKYLWDWFSYSKELPFYAAERRSDTSLVIGIIGDSWVADRRKLDSVLAKKLENNNISAQVISSGDPGAKTKRIYQNLFAEKTEGRSSKSVIESSPDYCVVISGVNDAVSQVGRGFYSYHVTKIIETLLHYNIHPIVVELPEFGIEECTNEMGMLKGGRNKLFSKVTHAGRIDNISTYRAYLQLEIRRQNLDKRITLVNFDRICPNYSECMDLYENSSHLSTKGTEKLMEVVAEQLTDLLKEER